MEALRLTATFPFDLMITDMLMPEMDGVETIMAIRREYPEVKIIAMSGGGRHVGIETLECARALGAHATLEKPFEFSTLLAHVQGLLAATPEPGQVHRRRAI
jgi:CheY-like chemotaxis protein